MRRPTDVLILDDATVRRVLSPVLARAAVSAALAVHSTGDLAQPRRSALAAADGRGSLLVMPARSGSAGMAVKLISLFPGNAERGLPVITGLIALFDQTTGAPVVLLAATAATELRTAAVSSVGTDLLARPDAHRLAVIGTGPQARAHLRALAGLRPWTSVAVAGRDLAKAEALAQWARSEGLPASVADVAAAVRGADTVCTTTSATEPLFTAGDVQPGTHVTAIGSHTPTARELPSALVAGAQLFVECREAARAEAGDLLVPLAEGTLDPTTPWTEIGEVIAGRPGRTDPRSVTVFKTVGLAIEDLATAVAAHGAAVDVGAGTSVAF